MPDDMQQTYEIIRDQEYRFAYAVAKKVLEKPTVSVWLVLVPILFLYYAHKIQQFKAGVHGFGKGLAHNKILALDSAMEEIRTGRSDHEYQAAFVDKKSGTSPDVTRVRETQIAEVELLKTHYRVLLREQGSSFQALIQKGYKTGTEYRSFLSRLAGAEQDVQDAVLRAYHPNEEAQEVARKMQSILHTLREEEARRIFE